MGPLLREAIIAHSTVVFGLLGVTSVTCVRKGLAMICTPTFPRRAMSRLAFRLLVFGMFCYMLTFPLTGRNCKNKEDKLDEKAMAGLSQQNRQLDNSSNKCDCDAAIASYKLEQQRLKNDGKRNLKSFCCTGP